MNNAPSAGKKKKPDADSGLQNANQTHPNKSIHNSCCIKNTILTHQKPTLLFYHIILQHSIYQIFYHSILYIKIIYTTY